MAKFGFRRSLLQPAAQHAAQVLSRPFRMMAPPDDDSAGPGWFESSRDLDQGLCVLEDFGGDAAIEQWRALEGQWQRLAQVAMAAAQRRLDDAMNGGKGELADEAQRRCRTAAPSSITASA